MKAKFNLEIKTPCSEDYKNFQPTENGGFCKSCQKEVIDFTTMTSDEILQFFKENNNGKTCGRFAKHQLEHTYQDFQPKKYNFFKSFGLAVLSLFSINAVQGQETKKKTEIVLKKKISEKLKTDEEILVEGIVSDEEGPLPGVNVVLKGSTIGAETDFDGHFKFPKPLKKGDILVFSFVGMETKEVKITNSRKLNVFLKGAEYLLMGEVQTKKVFKSSKKKGFWK